MADTYRFITDTDEPDAHPLPTGIEPAAIAAAQHGIAAARVTGSVGATYTTNGYTAEVRRLYTVEEGVNRATTLWLIETGPTA